jgi:hypothetical protein
VTLDLTHGIINEVYNTLSDMILDPPLQPQGGYKQPLLQLDKMRHTLDQVKPFWDTYIKVSKVNHPGSYTYNNMQEDQRRKYNSCVWWLELLEERLREDKSE